VRVSVLRFFSEDGDEGIFESWRDGGDFENPDALPSAEGQQLVERGVEVGDFEAVVSFGERGRENCRTLVGERFFRGSTGEGNGEGFGFFGAAADFVCGPLRNDAAFYENEYAVAEGFGFGEVVSCEEYGGAAAVGVLDHGAKVACAGDIEAGGGLVEKEDFG